MMIAFTSLKGSPGCTTLASSVAACWRSGDRRLVIELDPSGGSLQGIFGLANAPSIISLATEIRRERDPNLLWRHSQRLPGGLEAICGPSGAEQATAATAVLAELLPELTAKLEHGVLFADLGRLREETLPIAQAAARVLVLVRPVLHELATVEQAAEMLRAKLSQAGLVLVGSGRYDPAEISEAMGLPVYGRLAFDRPAPAMLNRFLSRRYLARTSRKLALRVSQEVGAS